MKVVLEGERAEWSKGGEDVVLLLSLLLLMWYLLLCVVVIKMSMAKLVGVWWSFAESKDGGDVVVVLLCA